MDAVTDRRARPQFVSPAPLAHVPALDGLRGLAVVGVLAFHAGYLTGGYLGVDLFFVLSGYLITSLLVTEWGASGRISLRHFYSRRLRRLLPALLLVIAAVGIAAHWEVLPTARDELRASGLATLGYVANWQAIFSGAGYWQRTALPPWLDHTWSLAIEEQFYLVWPLVAVAVLRRGLRRRRSDLCDLPELSDLGGPPGRRTYRRAVARLGLVAGRAALVSGFATVVWAWLGGDQQRLYLGTDTRAAAILLGAWAACRQQLVLTPGPASPARRRLARVSLGSAAVLALAWIRLDGTSNLLYRGGLVACGLAATAVIVDLTTPGTSIVGRLLDVAPLRSLGVISYGLYLWHWPIFQYFYPGRYGLGDAPLLVVRLTVALAAAVVSYRFVEQPIRRGRGPRSRLLPVLTPAAIGLCAVALILGTSGGYDIAPRSSTGTSSPVARPGTPRLMVVGDSVAYFLAEDGLIPRAGTLGLQVDDRAVIGCSVMIPVDRPLGPNIANCSPGWQVDVAAARPDVVLVLFGGYMGVIPASVVGVKTWPCEPRWDRHWRQQLDQAVDVLGADGAKVVLATAPTAELRAFKGRDADLFDRRQACSNAVIRRVARARSEADLLDLAKLVCPDATTCRSTLDGAVLRGDGIHFEGDGAMAVASRIGPDLVRSATRR